MPTKFEEIYSRALFKITDYSFTNIRDEVREEILQRYLIAAIVDFQHCCKIDLQDYDLEKKQFNNKLDDEIIEILALGIAYHWLRAQLLNREILRNQIHNKDYNSYSPANLLKEIRTLKDMLEQEYNGKINTYSFRHNATGSLKE